MAAEINMNTRPVIKKKASEINEINDEDDSDDVRLGHIQEEFKEIAEVNKIIANLCKIFKDKIAVEMATERFLCE